MPEAGELRRMLTRITNDTYLAMSYCEPGIPPEEREELKWVARRLRSNVQEFCDEVGVPKEELR